MRRRLAARSSIGRPIGCGRGGLIWSQRREIVSRSRAWSGRRPGGSAANTHTMTVIASQSANHTTGLPPPWADQLCSHIGQPALPYRAKFERPTRGPPDRQRHPADCLRAIDPAGRRTGAPGRRVAGRRPGAGESSYARDAIAEIAFARRVLGDAELPVQTVFFGGGTPTLLPPNDLAAMLGAIDDAFGLAVQAEITIEANPESVDAQALSELRAAGFTR